MNFNDYFENIEDSDNESGKKIREVRQRRRMTATELGAQADIKKALLIHYENGIRSVSDEALHKIADALGIPFSTLRARNLESVSDVMQILFRLEQKYGVKPVRIEDQIVLTSEMDSLSESFALWFEERQRYLNKEISEMEYQEWKDSFPFQYLPSEDGAEPDAQANPDTDEDDEEIGDNFKPNDIMRLRAHADYAMTGRNGDRIPREQQLRICAYVHCTKHFLNTESCIEFMPVDSESESGQADDSVLFEILNIMDKNAETNHFRIIQIQLSRIVLANLARKGFDRETFRRKQFLQEQLDFLYYDKKPKWHGMFFGLKFAHLNMMSEITGVSIREMFTGG